MAQYTLHNEPAPEERDALAAYSPLLQQLLYRRGIKTEADAQSFLNPSYEQDLHDPFLLHTMDKAVERILAAIKSQEKIIIYSDYDCDGIPGAVVLHDFFVQIGFAHFETYIPHRHYEGFGFNEAAAETLAHQGAKLIITIDCGTSDFDAVAKAMSLGVDVIITDHHEPKETIPSCSAVVNPKVGTTYPFDGLCGSGVIFKLVQALLLEGKKREIISLKDGQEKWLLDMVAVATIADMVPLRGENRALASYGLKVLRKSRRPGLQKLLLNQKASIDHLTEDDIGFTIAPRINAASRMGAPRDAFELLSTVDEAKAGACVLHLEKLNNERKGVVASMTKEVHKRLHAMGELPSVLVLGNPEWRPSLVGLVANKLTEEYKKPAFLWGKDGNGVIKGSCRSEGQTSVITLMNSIAEVFIEHGGHHMSGGFAVHEDCIHSLHEKLNTVYTNLGEKAKVSEPIVVDGRLALSDITQRFLNEHALLAPFGMDNPKPLFMFVDVVPTQVSVFGKTNEHTKLLFDTQGKAKEAIAFFMLPEGFTKEPKAGERVTLYAHVEQSFFMGRLQTRLRIVDIV